MKIFYCIEGTFNSGGMERVIINKANYLSEHNYDIFLITTNQKGRKPFFEINPKIQSIDLGINYSHEGNLSFLKKSVLFAQKQKEHKKKLKEQISKIQPDIIISTFGYESYFLHTIKDKSKKVIEIHFSKFFRLQANRSGIWHWVDVLKSYKEQRIVKKYDRFIVLTNEDKQYWGNLKNISVIPNFLPSLPKQKALLNNKKCIAVGRLDYQKGFDMLIDIWANVYKIHPEWELSIYGGGNLKNDLLNKIQEYNLQKTISIKSPTPEIFNAYNDSSILLFTSRFEGFGMVIIEAFSCGIPVISFECKCGPKDLIEDGKDGYLIKEGNLQEFTNRILYLIENVDIRKKMGQSAYQTSQKYTSDKIMEKWIKLFNDLLGTIN